MYYVIKNPNAKPQYQEIESVHHERLEAIAAAGGDLQKITTTPPEIRASRIKSVKAMGYDKAIKEGRYIS